MKRLTTCSTVVGTMLMLVAGALTFAQSEAQSTKQPYQPNGSEGGVTGTVSLSGPVPRPMQIDMSADPVCYENNPKPLTEFIVARDGRLTNVLVYVKASTALEGLTFGMPTTHVLLEQRGCRYLPHILALQVNQILEIRNSDNTTQNVHAMPKNNPDWNQTQFSSSDPYTHRFINPEIAIPFKNNQHPWMKAWVGVFSHPFFAVSDSKGAFTIEGLPPGNYTIGAWHEEFGEKTLEITVYPGSHQAVEINFDMTERRVAH